MNYLEEHKAEIFKKYSTEELVKDVENYINGKGKLNKTLKHFFEEEIYKCKSNRYKYTPIEVLQNEEMMNFILEYIKTKPNFYTGDEVTNVKSFFRNGTRYARKVANFCPKNARDIYFRYFPAYKTQTETLNCLDTSCGFGSRMSAVLLSGHNYFGIDPNEELQDKLHQTARFYYDNGFIKNGQKCHLYKTGSETYINDLKGIIDVSFTSPPYFNLETYSNDNGASNKNSNNYIEWKKQFVKPTIKNTYEYLKVGGFAMINVKNMTNLGKQKLFDDFLNEFMQIKGFEFVEIFDMEHQGKKNFTMNCNYTSDQYKGFKEPIMVFKKIE